MPKISGKNSADIKLVVDAMDLCYSKEHIDTFVIVSGDSDFSPLVSKLRENDKRVIGVGMKNSSSRLLIGNCDEFIFYDDIIRQKARRLSSKQINVPRDKHELFDFLIKTVQSLLMESRGVLYSSLIKDTMTRKQPDFNERAHGYSTFGDLLEESRGLGLLDVERDAAAGGTWVVRGLGKGIALEKAANGNGGGSSGSSSSSGSSRSSRRRRRSGRGGQRDKKEAAAAAKGPHEAAEKPAEKPSDKPAEMQTAKPADKAPAKKAPTRKKTVKKAPAKKSPAKKPATKKAPEKKPVAKKTAAKKSPVKKTATKKTSGKKTTRKSTSAASKKTAKKTTKKATGKKPAGKS
jgi:hypothetical protein